MDDLSNKVGGAIATGGAAASGLEDVLEQIQRGLNTFRLVTVGGDTWQSAEGTAASDNSVSLPLPACHPFWVSSTLEDTGGVFRPPPSSVLSSRLQATRFLAYADVWLRIPNDSS